MKSNGFTDGKLRAVLEGPEEYSVSGWNVRFTRRELFELLDDEGVKESMIILRHYLNKATISPLDTVDEEREGGSWEDRAREVVTEDKEEEKENEKRKSDPDSEAGSTKRSREEAPSGEEEEVDSSQVMEQ